MVRIRPFAALRPGKGKAAAIAALPYDVYSREEAARTVQQEPLSFLRIDRPETQFAPDQDMYAPEVYRKADELLREMEKNGDLIQEEKPCYYLYELTMDGRSQTGLVACSSVDDYLSGAIRKHENTRKEKEEDRIRHVDACSAQTGPIFLAFRSDGRVKELMRRAKEREPLYDFSSEDGITHRVWRVEEPSVLEELTVCFRGMEHTYIADGHHRAASAVAVSQMRRAARPNGSGREAYQDFLSVLFPADELRIFDYNRVLKDLNGKNAQEVLEALRERFTVRGAQDTPYRPEKKGRMGLYLGETWYRLEVLPQLCREDPVESLDVAYLQREVLEPVFSIRDPKTDPNIDFVGGIRGLEELERRCHEDCAAAFSMYPTSMEELFAVADAGRLMPPKSTWFEPKLRSGLLIHRIER